MSPKNIETDDRIDPRAQALADGHQIRGEDRQFGGVDRSDMNARQDDALGWDNLAEHVQAIRRPQETKLAGDATVHDRPRSAGIDEHGQLIHAANRAPNRDQRTPLRLETKGLSRLINRGSNERFSECDRRHETPNSRTKDPSPHGATSEWWSHGRADSRVPQCRANDERNLWG
jgi:hypothetical protein